MIKNYKQFELKLFINNYIMVKNDYPKIKDYVRAFNRLYGSSFTVEQLEKYLLLI